MNFIKRKRIKYALKFGKMEHKSSRLGILVLILAIIAQYNHYHSWALYLTITTLILFIIYLVSHRIEKKLYPSNFRG